MTATAALACVAVAFGAGFVLGAVREIGSAAEIALAFLPFFVWSKDPAP